MILTSMKHSEALATYKQLVRTYGFVWNSLIPQSAHALLAKCNKALSDADRQAALDEVKKEQNATQSQ